MFVPVATVMMAATFWLGAPLLARMLGARNPTVARGWLGAAGLAVAVSWFLPNPVFTNHTETFVQHFVGGGAASAFVAVYLTRALPAERFVQRAAITLSTVSVLGVANEVFELMLDLFFGSSLSGDAAWDLVANTGGAACTFILLELVIPGRGGRHARRTGPRAGGSVDR